MRVNDPRRVRLGSRRGRDSGLVDDPAEGRGEISKRYSSAELAEMRSFNLKGRASDAPPQADSVALRRKGVAFREARAAFLKAEGAKAALVRSYIDEIGRAHV